MKKLFAGVVVAAGLMSGAASAQVEVTDPWVRATVARQQATGAFMKLSAPRGARLIEARSPVAGVVELHEMAMDGDIMKMRAVGAIEVPAGRSVELRPGGYHVMLMQLKRQLNEGETVPLVLVFESGGRRETVEIQAPVRSIKTAPDERAMPMMHGGHPKKH